MRPAIRVEDTIRALQQGLGELYIVYPQRIARLGSNSNVIECQCAISQSVAVQREIRCQGMSMQVSAFA